MDVELDKEDVPVPAAPIVDEANMRIKKDYVPRSLLAEKVASKLNCLCLILF